jgi:hypothetical protein
VVRRPGLLALPAAVAALVVPAATAVGATSRPPVAASTRIPSGPYLFGDPVRARLDVLVDPARVDPDSVRVESRFDPYARAGRARTARTSADGKVHLVWEYTLECLWIECLGPPAVPRRIVPKASTIRFRTRAGKRAAVEAPWRPFRLVYRTIPVSGDTPATSPNISNLFSPLRTDDEPPRPDTWVSPTVLGALILSAAFLVLVAASLLLRPVVAFVRERRAARTARPQLTPLEQAVEQVEAAASDGAGSALHRETLALLARELRRAGLQEFVSSARRLAWSSEPPTRADSLELARRVREAVAGAGA